MGDLNQNIYSNEIRQFYYDLGIKGIHQYFNNLTDDEMDNTHINGLSPIDSIAVTMNVL